MSSLYLRLFPCLFAAFAASSLFGQAGPETDQAGDWLKKGIEALTQSRYVEAQSAFEHAVEADPTRPAAHLQLAAAILAQLHPGPRSSAANLALTTMAERELRRVLDLDATNYSGVLTLARLEYQLAIESADPAQRTARLDEAAQLYERISGTPDHKNKAILVALAQVDSTRPLVELTRALTQFEMTAANPGPMHDAALRKEIKEKYGSAIDDGIANVTAALRIDPAYVPAMNSMVLLLRERALLSDTEAESALDVQSANEMLRKSRPPAAAAPRQSVPALAQPSGLELIADLTEVIQHKPDFGNAYFARGSTYLRLSQYANAVSDFTKVIEFKPSDAALAYSNRAQAYLAMNKRDEEIADLTELIRLKPDAMIYLRRATSYRATGHCDRAIDDYSEAIRLSAIAIAYTYSGRSACRQQLGDIEGAAADQKVFDELMAKQIASRPGGGPKQFAPPAAVINNPTPKLAMDPSILAPPDANLPNINLPIYGDPLGKPGPPSAAAGLGGGIGSGQGGGVGSGNPGPVGGVYRAGNGVSQPRLLWKVEPEYSEEARKAKLGGVVALSVVVDENGEVRNMKVTKALGLGLDQKAIEAVGRWVFKPGSKDGKPVAVAATIEVNFRLL